MPLLLGAGSLSVVTHRPFPESLPEAHHTLQRSPIRPSWPARGIPTLARCSAFLAGAFIVDRLRVFAFSFADGGVRNIEGKGAKERAEVIPRMGNV